ncbi:hypothetical protein FRC12_016067 [Ceratobasidium sp. 428]|nr:hypothetical protein FRC12_016067 [Ceratobasidium sp. 428]
MKGNDDTFQTVLRVICAEDDNMHFNSALVAWLVAAGLATARPLVMTGVRRALPAPVDTATAQAYLNELVVEAPSNDPPYDRNLFPHWITISGKCDTRETVLIRDGTNVVTNSACSATSGAWYCE